MSNELKTLSKSQLSELISDAVGEYLDREVECEISQMDTPNIDSEATPGVTDKRFLRFDAKLSYEE
ncbi:MAG: hypothetical protein ACQETE_00680 [Bacteroidota bacterium]